MAARRPGFQEVLGPAGRYAAFLRDHGAWTIPLFVASTSVLIFLGVPRLLFCPLAGAAFGFWTGLVGSTLGTMLAYLASFLWIRGRRDEVRDLPEPAHPALAFLPRQPGLATVVLIRLLPVPGLLGTAALALSSVRPGAYLLGSLIGSIPQAAPLVLLGAGLLTGDRRQLVWLAVLAVGLILVSGCWMQRRRRMSGKEQERPAPAGSGEFS